MRAGTNPLKCATAVRPSVALQRGCLSRVALRDCINHNAVWCEYEARALAAFADIEGEDLSRRLARVLNLLERRVADAPEAEVVRISIKEGGKGNWWRSIRAIGSRRKRIT